MRSKLLLQDKFIRNNVVFFAGSMVVAFLSYLYHPLLVRFMNIEDFGEAQSLISLYTQLGVLVGVFGIIVTNLTSNYENIQERDVVISALYKIAYCIIGVIAFAIMISSAFLRDFFQFSSLAPFISLALLLLAGVSFTFRRSFLQGINNFSAMSWAGIIFAAGKVVFSVILVLIGLHSFGAISGLLIAQALSLFYVYLKTRNDFHVYLFKKNNLRQVIKNEYRYAMLILLSTASVTFLYTADVLMVKHWFLPEDAGLYSGIATIARIIFFATVSVSGVLFSAVKIKNSIEENRKILKKGLALTFLVAGTAAAALAIFPSFFIQLLIGSRYLIFSSLLVELSLLIFSVSIINLLFFYFLALRSSIIFSASLFGPVSIFILSIFRHQTLDEVVINFLIGSVLTLAVLLIGFRRQGNQVAL